MSLRTWQVHTLSDNDFDIDYLFHELAEVAYPLCAGFRYRGFLFLNISTSRLNRYSNRFRIVRESDRMTCLEIEVDDRVSPRIRRQVEALLAAGAEAEPDDCSPLPMEARWSDASTHRCSLCGRQ